MNTDTPDPLEALIRRSGEAWLIDNYSPPEEALPSLRRRLEQIHQHLRQRLGDASPNLNEQTLIGEYKRSAHKVRAFLQVLGATESPAMLVMAWRILQGMEIHEVQLTYHLQIDFYLRVTLVSPYGEPQEVYETSDIDDAALLRHFGIMKMDDKPVFDGFYALKR